MVSETSLVLNIISSNISGGTIPPVDGGWGWGEWTLCSTEICNGGTQTRQAKCNNPTPAFGGNDCPDDGTQDDEQVRDCSCTVSQNSQIGSRTIAIVEDLEEELVENNESVNDSVESVELELDQQEQLNDQQEQLNQEVKLIMDH